MLLLESYLDQEDLEIVTLFSCESKSPALFVRSKLLRIYLKLLTAVVTKDGETIK